MMRRFMNIVESETNEPWMDHGESPDDYEEWTPERGIDNFVRTEFCVGGCYSLALALHRATGWTMWGVYETDNPDTLAHAWVVRPDGRAVDINGVHSGGVAKVKYDQHSDRFGAPIRHNPPQKIIPDESEANPEYLEWAETLIAAHPDHFGIETK